MSITMLIVIMIILYSAYNTISPSIIYFGYSSPCKTHEIWVYVLEVLVVPLAAAAWF